MSKCGCLPLNGFSSHGKLIHGIKWQSYAELCHLRPGRRTMRELAAGSRRYEMRGPRDIAPKNVLSQGMLLSQEHESVFK